MEAILGRVKGRVQGVGFRYHTQDCALALGLKGYVTNLPDGRVEFFIQGDEHALKKALSQIKKGPEYSDVADISWEKVTTDMTLSDFTIRM
ncbi:MAG: acylphosphatase [Agarilytica sp.]